MKVLTFKRLATMGAVLATAALMGSSALAGSKGISDAALQELSDAGVDKYLGQFTPVSTEDVGDGWTKHTFDSDGGDGPICIAGTDYSVYTRRGASNHLLIFEQGGGACWQDFYFCNILAEDQAPPGPREGIFDFDSPDNPLADYNILYMPYCDGSVFSGDNTVVDPSFPFGPVRFHRGLRNQSAGMDVAKAFKKKPRKVLIAGSSAGGVGAAGFAPFLARFVYGNKIKLFVFNDAGPVTINPDALGAINARAADWDFEKFYPPSCTECDALGDATEVIKWRLDNDSGIREAIYETDADFTNRFFLGLLGDQPKFRQLVVDGHGEINEEFPKRYRRFIVAGDQSHTALQTSLFYTQDADGLLLNKWTDKFLQKKNKFWIDIVEPAVAP